MTDKSGRIRLYYVEDSAELRTRIERELAGIESVEVIGHAERAPEAIRAIRLHQPDIVVLDLQLIEGTGLDVLKELRGGGWPIVIVLTNHSDSTSKQRSLKAGAGYFFDKSTEFDQFLSTLHCLTVQAVRQTPTGAAPESDGTNRIPPI
jgi:Response regulator containing a CheY-like receiver domain and an HTH DNA-binding domain